MAHTPGLTISIVPDQRERVARLTNGALNDAARRVRADLNTLRQYQQPAYREDVTGILGELAYPLGTYRDCPAIWLDPCADSALLETAMVLGSTLQAKAPRKYAAILAGARLDVKLYVIWFDLPSEPKDDTPFEAAA